MAAGQVSIQFGLRGPNFCTVSACASGAHAIGEALRLLRAGDADVDPRGRQPKPPSRPWRSPGFGNMRALSTRNDEPQTREPSVRQGSRRLRDRRRRRLAGARDRGTRATTGRRARSASSAATVPRRTRTTSPPPARSAKARRAPCGARWKMPACRWRRCNTSTRTAPRRRPGTPSRSHAVKDVFGEHARGLMMSSTKSMTGHLLGAAGGLEAVVIALTLARGIVPPTINLDQSDPQCDLDFVPTSGPRGASPRPPSRTRSGSGDTT